MWADPGLKFNFLDYATGTQHSNNWDSVKTDNHFTLKDMKSYFFNSHPSHLVKVADPNLERSASHY